MKLTRFDARCWALGFIFGTGPLALRYVLACATRAEFSRGDFAVYLVWVVSVVTYIALRDHGV